MSEDIIDMDALLDAPLDNETTAPKQYVTFEGIDPRIKLLSYSSLLTLHSCPRKFELYRKKATDDEMNADAASNQNVTFAFGHIVGEGIQDVFDGVEEDAIIWKMFLGWHASLADNNPKQNKSFYLAVLAIQRLIALRRSGFLEEYELLQYNGRSAKELSFRIELPDGFFFRGSVDAVLRHKVTGKILVLECKTSSSTNLNPTTFKNSSQAVGYSVVLDVIAPDISNYEVLYLVYLTKDMSYEVLRFPKTYLQRAQWIQELMLDVEVISLYDRTGVYPMRGESCYSWFRDCEYLNQCTLSTDLITEPPTVESVTDTKVYDIQVSLADLIEAQMKKVIPIVPVEWNNSDAKPMDGDEML
jgi:hypothetical protein